MHQVKDSLENCQDLDAAYTALRGEKSLEAQTPVTASAVTNVLGLLISGPQLSLEVKLVTFDTKYSWLWYSNFKGSFLLPCQQAWASLDKRKC